MTVTDESRVERLRAARQLTDERMAATHVEGALGLVMEELTEHGLRLAAPVPLRDGRPDPIGVTAAVCALTDTAAGLVAARGSAYGEGGATVELRLDYLAPFDPGTRRLTVDARQLHVAGGASLSEAVLFDDQARVLARAIGHFARLEAPPSDADWPPREPAVPVGQAADLIDALRLEPASDPEERSVRLPEALSNPRLQIHGGMVIAIAELAQREVRDDATSADAPAPRLLSMQVDFLRPAECDGTDLTCRTGYERHGRRFSTLRTELLRPDGRLAAVATGLWSALD